MSPAAAPRAPRVLRRLGLLALAVALSACGGGSGGGGDGGAGTTSDFAVVFHQVFALPENQDPFPISGISFTNLDAPEGSFDSLLPP